MENPTPFPNIDTNAMNSSQKLVCLPSDPTDNEKQIIDLPDISFNDEFDCDGEDNDSQNEEGKISKDNKAEILKLADTEDGIKANRTMMVQKLTSMGSDYNLKNIVTSKFTGKPVVKPENHEVNSLPVEQTTFNKENIPGNIIVDNSSKTQELTPKSTSQEICVSENSQSTVGSQSETSKSLTNCAASDQNGLPIVEGYLKKRTNHFLHPWHTRFLVLKDNKLLYYKNNAKDRMVGCIDFGLLSATFEIDPKDSKRFMITTVGSNKVFTFKADNEEDAKRWTDALALHLHLPEVSKRKTSIATIRNFWKHDRISEKKFLTESKTGDLLLFKGGSLAAKLQRSVTRSEYDHVGLILKYSDGDIVLLEASGNQGVGLCRWSTFKRNDWHILYEKVVYRKLQLERSRDLIDKAEHFVRSVVGKKYSITAKKLFQKKSTSIGMETPEDRTFFCSELIAACYKRMGLLPQEISSSQYLPVSFSADRKLPLLKGAKLEDELLIDFNL